MILKATMPDAIPPKSSMKKPSEKKTEERDPSLEKTAKKVKTPKKLKKLGKVTIKKTAVEKPQRLTPKPDVSVKDVASISMVKIGDTIMNERLPKKEDMTLRASSYYQNNREYFTTYIN